MQARKRNQPGKPKPKDAEESIVELPTGEGATRLRSAINSLVGAESDRIAKALIDKTIKGNMTSAKLVVELADPGKNASAQEKKKRRGPSPAQLLASEPEWQESHSEGDGVTAAPTGPAHS